VRARGLLALALTCGAAMHAAPAFAGPVLPLDHAGRWITDAQGRVVILRGVNMVYKRAPYAPDAIGFSEDDAAFLASEGYDNVRVGVIYKGVEPQPGRYDDAYLDRIDATVDMLARHGIVSMLDFHQDLYNERFQGEGWPDWAVDDDGLPAQPQTGFPGNYLVMPALQRAFDHFWANDPGPGDPAGMGMQDRYAAAWRHVAARFGDHPAVLGYDLMNEPWPGTLWHQCANPYGCPLFDATMSQFIERTRRAIRSVDPTTLVFYEPNVIFNYGANTNVADSDDAHSAFSFHNYCLPHDATNVPLGCDVFDDLVFENAEAHSARTGDALLLTEFGATTDATMLTAATARAERFMIGWQWWHYCGCNDPTTAGPGNEQALVADTTKPPEGSNLDAAKLALLTRPHPRVVAGTPSDYGFDPQSRRFALSYATRRANGSGRFVPEAETEITMPRRQYPSGYAVQVRGGAIASRPGESVLRVSACPGADRISVTVTPQGATEQSCPPPAGAVVRLRLSVSPRKVRAGERVRLRFFVRAGAGRATRPVQGAVLRIAGARARTDRRGRATVRMRFTRPGRRIATATATGFRAARATVRVLASRPRR
jgi:endoglycosylceramidase